MGNLTRSNLGKYILSGIVVCLLVACSGGGGSNSTVVSTSKPTLSSDQAAFETIALSPSASYTQYWRLPITGIPVYGTHYLASSNSSLTASPLTNGTQEITSSGLSSIANSLDIPPSVGSPTRYLINGKIVAGSSPAQIDSISYQGTGVKVVIMSADGTTPVSTKLMSNISVVHLTGLVTAAPTEFAQWFNTLFYNTALLSSAATWQSGAAYMKYTSTQVGNIYYVLDYTGTTTGTSPNPRAAGTTIAALMASGGINSSDLTTYTMSNGTVSVVNGVTTYVANNPIPNMTTIAYRTYYELNGNVYAGELIKDGTVIGGSPYPVAAPGTPSGYTTNYSSNYQIRLNKAGVTSLQSAFVNKITAAAGTSLTMIANETVLVPAGTIVTTPNHTQVTINGTSNTINATVGTIVNVPSSATGPANNVVVTGAT